jgi:hypothetical protein
VKKVAQEAKVLIIQWINSNRFDNNYRVAQAQDRVYLKQNEWRSPVDVGIEAKIAPVKGQIPYHS